MNNKYKTYADNFLKYRFLLKQLVVNDIKIKYRRSVLGIVWSVLHPLMMMIVLTIVFSSIFKSAIYHFPVYILTGRIIWDMYSQATSSSMGSVIDNSALIKKVYVPKYIFPLAKVCSSLVNTLFSLVALALVMIVTGVKPTPTLILLPLPIFYTFLFATGVGLFLSAYTVFFRDLNYLYEVLLTAWSYFTPTFYPAEIIPKRLSFILTFNPLWHFIAMFRKVTMYGMIPSLQDNIMCLSIGLISIIIGFIAFYRKQDKFILYV